LTASRISLEVGSFGLTLPRTVSENERDYDYLTETEMQVCGIFADADAISRRKVR
jgi:hypothetical protein